MILSKDEDGVADGIRNGENDIFLGILSVSEQPQPTHFFLTLSLVKQ